MRVIGVIPARLAATRFPGKPLATLLEMPMIGHCYYRTQLALGIDATYVATCDNAIADYIRSINGNVVMTSVEHTRATTRTAEALSHIEAELGEKVDVVVMVQGDEPLIPPKAIGDTLQHFIDPNINVVNIMSRLKSLDMFVDKNNVKVVVDHENNALYFSREPIPSPWKGWDHISGFMQSGIMAFRRDTLLHFNSMPETELEQIESVDMNRLLQTGSKIRMLLTEAALIGVDTPDELVTAEQMLRNDPDIRRYLK